MIPRKKHHIDTRSNILALDTANGKIAACIIRHGYSCLLQADEQSAGVTRSTAIIPALVSLLEQAALNWKDMDALALGAGPGSFTGLRIAAATLAGINAGLKLPIIHLSSLAITARQTNTAASIRVLEDARAGELFCGFYRHGTPNEADRCMPWSQVESFEPGLFCCHNEPAVKLEHWTRLALTLPRSQALALEVQTFCSHTESRNKLSSYPLPVYLQLSQAEKNLHAS